MIRKRKRRKAPEEHSNHERWLVSYADFITLLFAFFVVLYATAQVDNRKVAQVAAAIKDAFQQLGVFSGSDFARVKEIIVVRGVGDPKTPNIVGVPVDTSPPPSNPCTNNVQNNAAAIDSQGTLFDTKALEQQLQQALGDEIHQKKVQMRTGPDGLVVSIREIGFFDSGDAKLLPEAKPTLARLAKILEQKNFQVRVEGHTDNVPMHNAKFNSNWELSTARATEVVTMLVHDYSFAPQDLSVAGYAEFRPVFSNDTEEGRRGNRRIDLVVIGMRNQPGDVAPRPGHTQASTKH